jgi:hypothetical protein
MQVMEKKFMEDNGISKPKEFKTKPTNYISSTKKTNKLHNFNNKSLNKLRTKSIGKMATNKLVGL